MSAITGVVRNGQIVLDAPPDLPEGTRVEVVPVEQARAMRGLRPDPTAALDSDVPETQEQIEEWLRWYRALEPLEFTPEEEAELAAWRQKKKEHGMARSQQRIEDLFP
jgi:hypothetical protein